MFSRKGRNYNLVLLQTRAQMIYWLVVIWMKQCYFYGRNKSVV